MAVQQSKVSKSRKNMRRSHHAMNSSNLGRCPRCGQAAKPHCVCNHCGHYRGRQVVDKEGL